MATLGPPPDRQQEIMYTGLKIIGNGSFGVVYQARLSDTNEAVAIKKVLQDKRFKNRELQIMRRLDHCNIIHLQYFFYSPGDKVGVACTRGGRGCLWQIWVPVVGGCWTWGVVWWVGILGVPRPLLA